MDTRSRSNPQSMPSRHSLSFTALAIGLSLSACDRGTQEGDLKFIGYRYTPDASAYVSVDSNKYMGEGYAEALNAAPHLRIHGSWCDLTWTETKPDGSKENKSVSFPTSNIHSFKWKE